MRNDDLIPNMVTLLRDAGHEGLHRLDWIRQVQNLYPDNPPTQSAVDRRFTDLIGHSSKRDNHPDLLPCGNAMWRRLVQMARAA